MRIHFYSHYFSPEGNAPATRVHALCKRWVEQGHDVTVITGVPNVPNGVVYDGYRNKLAQSEVIDGVRVKRVWTYIAANEGTIKRIANYVSYMATATLRGLFLKRPDVVIATSPQFFCGWAGVLTKWLRRRPFVLEIRDIWPESIAAVGAMKPGKLMRLLEWLELRMYAAATHVVTVGDGYRQQLEAKGVPPAKISVISNGVDPRQFLPQPPDEVLLDELGLRGKHVCAYVGTVGMACGLGICVRAARLLEQRGRDDIVFLIVGDGAARAQLQQQAADEGVSDRVIFTGRQPKERMPAYLSIADSCLVHLAGVELFASVMPSKLFEVLAMAKPVVLGVKGQAAAFLQEAGGGICIEPESEEELVRAVCRLADTPTEAAAFGRAGRQHVLKHYDRDVLAADYRALLQRLASADTAVRLAPDSQPR